MKNYATMKKLHKMKKKYGVAAKGTKKQMANSLVRVRGVSMNKNDLVEIFPLLDDKNKKIAEKSIELQSLNVKNFKGMWKPNPPKPISKMSKNELIKESKKFRNAWENITTQNMDRSDERLNEESMKFLRDDVRWHYSDTSKNTALWWLNDNCPFRPPAG